MFIKNYVSFGEKELFAKLDDEIDNVAKTRKHMGIIEAVIQEKERQIFLQGEERGLERGLEKGQVFAINKMNKKGFSSEVIADILEIPLNSVEKALKDNKLDL